MRRPSSVRSTIRTWNTTARSKSGNCTERECADRDRSPLEHLFRRQAGRIVAHLARLLGPARLDLALAEEAVQEAMLRAL